MTRTSSSLSEARCNCLHFDSQKFNHYLHPVKASSRLPAFPLFFTSIHPLQLKVKMIRAGAVRALYAATRTQVPRQLPAFRSRISTSLLQSSRVTPSFVVPSIRYYSAPAGLSKDEVQGRIMDLLKNFDKVRTRCL